MPPKQKRWVSLGGLGGLALVISFALNESTLPNNRRNVSRKLRYSRQVL